MVLAARGTRDLDDGQIPIDDEDEKKQLRSQALGVWIKTLAVTAIGAAAVYFL